MTLLLSLLRAAGLRRLLSEALLHPAPGHSDKTILDLYFLWDGLTWKGEHQTALLGSGTVYATASSCVLRVRHDTITV